MVKATMTVRRKKTMRKACIIQATEEVIPVIERNLPPDVTIAKRRECFDRNCWELRLEGAGLPDWCKVAEGCCLTYAIGQIRGGQLHLVPGVGLPVDQVSDRERIQEG
jgi:hypothetical protein